MAQKSDPQASRTRAPKTGELFDELLVTLVKQGDKAAAERLFQRWNPRLLRTSRRYAGDAALAEQLAQDCWLAVWRGIGGLRDPARFAPWVFGIMRNKGAGAITEAVQNRKMVPSDAAPDEATPGSQEDRLAINQAFASLPPDQRLAAHLHFVEGLTLVEIATVQSIPTGTAKSRLFHARRKLKAALSSETPQGETT